MAMSYCHTHDHRYDRDWHTECPQCGEDATFVELETSIEVPLSIGAVVIGHYPDLDVTLRIDTSMGDYVLDAVLVSGLEIGRTDADALSREIWEAAAEKVRSDQALQARIAEHLPYQHDNLSDLRTF